ncbi:torsin interacting protein isoform X2 [Lycorma delicatula]
MSADRTLADSKTFAKDENIITEDEDDEVDSSRCEDCDIDIENNKGHFYNNATLCLSCFEGKKVVKTGSKLPKEAFVILLPVLLSAVTFYFCSSENFLSPIQYLRDTLLTSSVDDLDCRNVTVILQNLNTILKTFPNQSKTTLLTFAAGISRVYNTDPIEPTSFLLFHKAGDETANCLLKEISKIAANCLTKTNNVIIIKGEQLKNSPFAEDSGELINMYKNEVLEKKVMTVYDINKVPGNVIKEFHYFCDTYQPLVKEAIYFFTMSTDDDLTEETGLIKKVDNKFREIWGTSLEYHLLDPLITRMTSYVVPVIWEEKYISGC